MSEIRYLGFIRSDIYKNVTTEVIVNGRLHGTLHLEAFELDGSRRESGSVEFAIRSPRDIASLIKGFVGTLYPEAYAKDVERGYLCTAELTETDLPWRYTPKLRDDDILPPWIVLVVGTANEITLLGNGNVQITQSALEAHDLRNAAQWAHVDKTAGVARLISPRPPDQPDTEYITIIVPAFDDDAQLSWVSDDHKVTLPCFHHWTFQTGTRVSFPELVGQLTGLVYADDAGYTRVAYPRIPGRLFEAPGALWPPGADLYPSVDSDIAADIMELPSPPTDGTDRITVGVPTYGAQWFDEPLEAEWAKELNHHPANRIAAGLGVAATFHFEDLLIKATLKQAGDFEIADDRIRNLTLGTAATGSLWARRLPQDEHEQLMLLGPSMSRIAATDEEGTILGTALDAVTSSKRPLAAALFSGAAQRILRPSAGWTRLAGASAEAINVLESANNCPSSSLHPGSVCDLLREIGVDWNDVLSWIRNGEISRPIDLINDLINEWGLIPEDILDDVEDIRNELESIFRCPHGEWIGDWESYFKLFMALMTTNDAEALASAIDGIDPNPDADGSLPLTDLEPGDPTSRPCTPVDLIDLTKNLISWFKPTGEDNRTTTRVLSTLDGIEDTAPPRIHPYLKIPLWIFLRDCAADWLLPDLRDIPQNTIAVLKPNPRFIEAFMVGANTRLLEALRRYDLRITPSVTPLKVFWGRFNEQGKLHPDIDDIADFGLDTKLGSHVVDSGGRVALLLRSPIFEEYENTSLYLLEAAENGDNEPDFGSFGEEYLDPERERAWPTFQGAVGDIVLFGFDLEPEELLKYWVVFEEGDRDARFAADPKDDPQILDEEGASFAALRIKGFHRVVVPAKLLLEI